MRFDYRDLFRAPRIAFSFQRLWIQFLGILAGYGAYVALTYLAFLAGGVDLGAAWSRYGLLPCAAGQPLPWAAAVLFWLGVLVLGAAWLLTATAVARAAYMHLKGNHFYTWKEAVRFAVRKKGGAVAATPAAILLIAFFVALGGVVVGLLGRIPYAGEFGISLFTLIWFAASAFLVFLGLALAVSLAITPSVLACTDDDAFEGIFQSFSTLAAQPWRLAAYGLLVAALSAAGFAAFAIFAKQSWLAMSRVLALGMGEKYADLSYAASYLFQNWVYPAVEWARALPCQLGSACFFSQEIVGVELPFWPQAMATLMAVMLVLVAAAVAAYPLAVLNTGGALVFLILKKKKDDENLLERKDKEEETEEEEAADAAAEGPDSRPAKKRAAPRKKPAARARGRASRKK
jgi:hypothetical protein